MSGHAAFNRKIDGDAFAHLVLIFLAAHLTSRGAARLGVLAEGATLEPEQASWLRVSRPEQLSAWFGGCPGLRLRNDGLRPSWPAVPKCSASLGLGLSLQRLALTASRSPTASAAFRLQAAPRRLAGLRI